MADPLRRSASRASERQLANWAFTAGSMVAMVALGELGLGASQGLLIGPKYVRRTVERTGQYHSSLGPRRGDVVAPRRRGHPRRVSPRGVPGSAPRSEERRVG